MVDIKVRLETVTPDECVVQVGSVELTFRRSPGPRGGRGRLVRSATSAPLGVSSYLPRPTFLRAFRAALEATIQAEFERRNNRRIGQQLGIL